MRRLDLKPTTWALIGILALSVLIRLGAAFYLGNEVTVLPGTQDQVSYHNLALRLIDGKGFTFGEAWWPLTQADEPTAHWSYLYVYFLAFIYWLFGSAPLAARVVQVIIVGLLQPYLIYWIGKRLFGVTIGLLAALLQTLYIYFIYYTGTLMTEPFYITGILGAFCLSILLVDRLKKRETSRWTLKISAIAVILGLTLGSVILLRQLFLLFLPFLFIWIIWASWGVKKKEVILALGLITLILAVLVLPFTAYNQSRFDQFVLLNTNAGYALYWANHPIHGTDFIPILSGGTRYLDLIPQEIRHLDEAALDSELLSRGIAFITEEPLRYLQLSLSRIPDYFIFWPTSGSSTISNLSRVGSFGILLPFMLAGIVLAVLDVFRPEGDFAATRETSRLREDALSSGETSRAAILALLLVFIVVYTLIHVLTWTLVRYRLPVDAFLILFSALTVAVIIDRLKGYLSQTRRETIPGQTTDPLEMSQ